MRCLQLCFFSSPLDVTILPHHHPRFVFLLFRLFFKRFINSLLLDYRTRSRKVHCLDLWPSMLLIDINITDKISNNFLSICTGAERSVLFADTREWSTGVSAGLLTHHHHHHLSIQHIKNQSTKLLTNASEWKKYGNKVQIVYTVCLYFFTKTFPHLGWGIENSYYSKASVWPMSIVGHS